MGSVNAGPTGCPQEMVTRWRRGSRIERTVMRFYLALQAWLDVRDQPAQEQLLARLERWFDLTDEYPRQLRELDRETYLDQKQREYANQQRLQDDPPPRRRILPLD